MYLIEGSGMDERIARLRAHQKNIVRYEGLLKTKLSEAEKDYLEKRLSEERFAISMLQSISFQAGRNLPSSEIAGEPDAANSNFVERSGPNRLVAAKQDVWRPPNS
jgi:hypothetical protein